MKALRVLAVLVGLIFAVSIVSPVLADQANPDEPPTIVQFDVYHNLLETNDYLLLIYENTPYATTPNATMTDAFYWRLFDNTNTTEYGWSQAYAFMDKGYGYNVVSLYFDNATAPTWEEECYIRLSGNPSVFTTPPEYEYQVQTEDYCSENATEDVQDALEERILFLASDLAARWEVATNTFLYEGETGRYLSIAGQAFFRGAIYGLQGLCPDLFPYAIGEITIDDRDFETTYVTSLSNQWAGTWVADAKEAGEDFFEVDYDLASVILVLVIGAAILVADHFLSQDSWSGFIDVSIWLIVAARLDLYGLAFLALLAAVAVVYVAQRIWGIGR